ncbi:hypothetical protein H0H81_008087, partial [Sphagnurus paluster]
MSSSINTQWCENPPLATHIGTYNKLLQAHYTVGGSERMGSLLVTKIRLFKTRATSRHEYISIELLAPDGQIFNLAVERGRGEIVDRVDRAKDTNTKSDSESDAQVQAGSPDVLSPPPEPVSVSASASTSALPSRNPSNTCLPLSSSQTDVAAATAPSFIRKLNSASSSISSPSFPSSSSTVASLDSLFRKRNADDK